MGFKPNGPGCCECCKVTVTLRRDDGTPISNDPDGDGSYLETIGISYGSGPTLVAFDLDGAYHADGVYVSDSFPVDVTYTITIRIVSKINDSVSFEFAPSYLAGRACDTFHEYDFCDARFRVVAVDCLSLDPITDLEYVGTGGGTDVWGLQMSNGIYGGLGAPACSVAPPYAKEWRYFGTILGDANLGNGHDGPGTYVDFWARLRERPYTCPASEWSWVTQKPPTTNSCDQDGRYKPRCGGGFILCGEVNAADASMFPLGTDWIYIGGPEGNCGFACSAGPYGSELRQDCSPSGLFPRVITYTAVTDGPNNIQGDLAGTAVTLTCTGFSGGEFVFTSEPIANLAGEYACCERFGVTYINCENIPYQQTEFTLRVGGPSGISLDILDSNPLLPCPPGKVHPPGAPDTQMETASAGGGGSFHCHPVLIDMYIGSTYMGSLTE